MSSLGALRAVTIVVPDLHETEQAYAAHLGYRTVRRGTVSAATAASWGAPKAAGRNTLLMVPESGEPAYLRFIENTEIVPPPALTTFGWAAAEFTIKDTDALAVRLAESPFRIIGPPADLNGYPMIRAMQAIAPGGECLYLTRIGPGAPLPLAEAKSFVGRVFIMVLASGDIEATRAFYAGRFGNEPSPPEPAVITMLGDALGLSRDRRYGLSIMPLAHGTLLELDDYPIEARPRPVNDGDLPGGIAIVSFDVTRITGTDLITDPQACDLPELEHCHTASLRGSSGELIELIGAA
jgi:catechol 2,3-dioxygenase-like lactoylglutathione lyase family enzyme